MDPPYLLELICLGILVVILVALGALIRRRWSSQNEPLPVPVAVGSWAIVVVLYASFGAFLLFSNPAANPFSGIGNAAYLGEETPEETYRTRTVTHPDGTEEEVIYEVIPVGGNNPNLGELDRRIRPLIVYAILGLLCVAYYTLLMVNALSQRLVERIDPFSARIEDPSEFSEARRLALRGDIDGAVRVYRTYTEKTAEAQFEAARLLKSHDRFEESAELLMSISTRFYGNHVIWADATYQLAKIYDNHLDRQDEGAVLLRQILERAPETRFGQLAGNEMSRIRVLGGIDSEGAGGGRAAVTKDAAPKPAPGTLRQFDEPVQVRRRGKHTEEDEDYTPPVDPFYARRYGMDPEELAEAAEAENADPVETEDETKEDS